MLCSVGEEQINPEVGLTPIALSQLWSLGGELLLQWDFLLFQAHVCAEKGGKKAKERRVNTQDNMPPAAIIQKPTVPSSAVGWKRESS